MVSRFEQNGVGDNDGWDCEPMEDVDDLLAIGPAVQAVVVLHDGNVAAVQRRARFGQRGGYAVVHFGQHSGVGRGRPVCQPDDTHGGPVRFEPARQGGAEGGQAARCWRVGTE